MSKLLHCGLYSRVTVHRIVSSVPAYAYQILYELSKCKGCKNELMFWAGEYPDGKVTPRYPIPKAEFPHWKRRAENECARPEPQLTSEYSKRIKGDIESQLRYLKKLERKRKMPLKQV